ncbi:zinc finger MYM-type protein 1 [Trichonephila clavipes]|nr:zinc finger MYM-type protein 1 [Trichonephila clavipes]
MRYILKWYPYKIHITQTLKPQDQKTRLEFPAQFLADMEVDDAWPWKVLWSDEAHFYLNGAVNSRNCHLWGTSPPNILHQQPLYSDHATAWCGLLSLSFRTFFL